MSSFRLLDSAVALGMTADDVVIAAGRLERNEALEPHQRRVLDATRGVIHALVSGTPGPSEAGLEGFSPAATTQLLLRATRQMSPPGVSGEKYLADLDETLGRALAGDEWDGRVEGLRQIRKLFLRIGQISLSEASAMAGDNRAEFPAF
jgi:hypothetical protein